jgi:hypothetical protein
MNKTTANPNTNFLWRFISYIFHPIFIPIYLFAFLIYAVPSLFIKNSISEEKSLMLNVILNLVFFQAFTVFLLKQLKFIDSIFLRTNKERIVPIFAYCVYSFWVWAFVLLKNKIHYPSIAINTGLTIFLVSSLTLVLNSFYKISMHMIGAGMALGLSIIVVIKTTANPLWILFGILLTLTILLTRKNDSDHTNFELYSGFMCGFIPMILLQFAFYNI